MNVATGGSYPNYTYNTAANAAVVFSCGCTGQAGTATTDAAGTFTVVAQSTATPSAPDPTYTIVPGRNYVVIASAGAGGTPPEGWDIQFAGRSPRHNLYLDNPNASDVYTTAVGLFVYYESPPGITAFDDWNFNTLLNWYGVLKASPNAAETTLLNDIASQSGLDKTLYPSAPGWDPSHATNGTIASALNAVKTSGDPAVPTPCPTSGCSGTPSP
jgi:hypothetical protein